jgi:hypothetical protein
MDPNEVVNVRKAELLMAELQHPHSLGECHQVPTVPATMTWIEYWKTWCPKKKATKRRKR